MSSGLLLDPMPSPSSEVATTASGSRYRPYASPNHHVTKGRYITSNDPRGYIPVYEYPLNGQWIMLDMDDGYVLWTGIWKALGNAKADIVKMIESQPDLAPQLRRVRGGYLKIQGTWMPYEIAATLARRVAWPIRYELIPLFGPNFPGTCLSPDQPGFGQIVKPGTGKRRARRNVPAGNSSDTSKLDWTVISPALTSSTYPSSAHASQGPGEPSNPITTYSYPPYAARRPSDPEIEGKWRLHQDHPQPGSPIPLHSPYGHSDYSHYHRRPSTSSSLSTHERASLRLAELPDSPNPRYAPYPVSSTTRPRADSWRGSSPRGLREPQHLQGSSFAGYPSHGERVLPPNLRFGPPESITLAPIIPPESQRGSAGTVRDGDSSLTLPPISALDVPRHGFRDDPSVVLERLRSIEDDGDLSSSACGSRDADSGTVDFTATRHMSLSPVESHKLTHIKPDASRSPSVRYTSLNTAPSTSSGSVSTPSPYFSSSSARSGSTAQSPVSPMTPPSYATRRGSDAGHGSHYYAPAQTHGERELPSVTAVSRRRDSDDTEKRFGDYRDDIRMEHAHRAPAAHAEDRGWGGNDHPADPTKSSWRPW
ncbi:hypothetical protein EIP91_008570 [Steccherinum ochraceum]|uniref:HTH APSES-type domain-containing protein n=1 Tax=Steccherinum ochraceum TaxID=92696 RepID=A0A4R0R5C8_9APHY|nr:hypothetical protein EIP91_008570 [Steccherinum ochraceum]